MSNVAKKIFRDPSGHDVEIRKDGSKRVSLSFVHDQGKVDPQYKDTCNIDYVINSYVRNQNVIHVPESEYRDLTKLPDYQEALNAVIQADELFGTLPAHVRKEFDHNPKKFVDALSDPSMNARLIELGIYNKPEKPEMASESVSEGNDGDEVTG